MSGKVLENKLVTVTKGEDYYCYDWIIKFSCNCDDCLRNSCYISITSPNFKITAISSKVWYLSLCISYGKSMTLQVKDDFLGNCLLKIGVRDKKNEVCYRTEYRNRRDKLEFINPHFIRNCNYWHEGVLTFVVEIFKPKEVISIPVLHSEKVLKNLLHSENLRDVILVAGDREFRAHKAILAAQSSVFLAMFGHDMREKAENKVIIEDIGAEVVQLVLNYMYTGSVDKEQLKETAIDVLVAADKYALEDLVKVCEEALIQGLNNDNVFKVLLMANSYKLNSLKKAAVDFIACEIKDLVETDEFNNLENLQMDLLKEIILAIENRKGRVNVVNESHKPQLTKFIVHREPFLYDRTDSEPTYIQELRESAQTDFVTSEGFLDDSELPVNQLMFS